jgi:hypothetical protein
MDEYLGAFGAPELRLLGITDVAEGLADAPARIGYRLGPCLRLTHLPDAIPAANDNGFWSLGPSLPMRIA